MAPVERLLFRAKRQLVCQENERVRRFPLPFKAGAIRECHALTNAPLTCLLHRSQVGLLRRSVQQQTLKIPDIPSFFSHLWLAVVGCSRC